MGVISSSDVQTLMDSVASAGLIFTAAIGSSSEANTVAKAAANDIATITAVADNDVQADLAMWFRQRALGLTPTSLYNALQAYNIWVALDQHVGSAGISGVAGLDTFLQANNIRVSPMCKAVGFPLSPEQILPPVVDPMATFVVSGSGAGLYTHVADIDTQSYGRAWLELVVTSSSGLSGASITATVTGLQFDGYTPTVLSATLMAASSEGSTAALGTLGTQADSYDSVTAISITGGTAGDAFSVRSRVERVISPVS